MIMCCGNTKQICSTFIDGNSTWVPFILLAIYSYNKQYWHQNKTKSLIQTSAAFWGSDYV